MALLFSNFFFENLNKNKEISIKKKIPNKNMLKFFLLSKYPVSISTVIYNKEIIKDFFYLMKNITA